MTGSSDRRRSLRVRVNHELQQFSYHRQWVQVPTRPTVFQVELTNRCPMTCEMCPRTDAMTRPLGMMSAETFRQVIDECAGVTSDVFLHHFGDSLLHPELGELIAYATARSVRTYLSANPILLTRSRIEAIVDSGLHELVLSLDGATPETSARVRGDAARDIELAARRIEALLAYRASTGSSSPRVILQFVRQKQNAHEVDAWLRRWEQVRGIDRIKVKSYVTWDGQHDAINDLRITPKPAVPSITCDKPWTSVTVLWDGRVVPCCFDYDGLHVLGDVADSSLEEIWNGPSMHALREAHRSGDLSGVRLCARCVDKEGYDVGGFYPLNRLRRSQPLGDEWRPEPGEAPSG